MKLHDILTLTVGKDTRDNTTLFIYNLNNQVSKDDYINISEFLKGHKCYYSKFAKGFICKNEIDLSLDFEAVSSTKETQSKQNPFTIKYGKKLLDYITIEEYKQFLIDYAKEHVNKTNHIFHYRTIEEAVEKYTNELLYNFDYSQKYDSFGELDYIRESIIHKSLGLPVEDLGTNGHSLYYRAIWDKLPIINGLKVTDEAYTASWGYDQTNIDIAYRLNVRLWGLDVLKCGNEYLLVRMKDEKTHYFAFSDKNGVRNFKRDLKPLETFKQDASQTGFYR